MTTLKDLRMLPKVRDSWTYLYVEHAKIEQDAKAIAIFDERGKIPVPCATLTTLMLGPGTSISHAAIRALADNGCLVVWAGEEGVRFYAQGAGETRSADNLMRQAWIWADAHRRLQVVLRMYRTRFAESLPAGLTLQQIRGREGVRVREAYARASRESGVAWQGRAYNRGNWAAADPVNRALSAANSCLYGICQAAIVSAGYSTGLGFIHTGKALSFVYDVADLYKTEVTIPAAFEAVAEGTDELERRVRYHCRDQFQQSRILQRIVPDIDRLLTIDDTILQAGRTSGQLEFDVDEALPGGLWDPERGEVSGGVNYGDEPEGDGDDRDDPGAGAGQPAR